MFGLPESCRFCKKNIPADEYCYPAVAVDTSNVGAGYEPVYMSGGEAVKARDVGLAVSQTVGVFCAYCAGEE